MWLLNTDETTFNEENRLKNNAFADTYDVFKNIINAVYGSTSRLMRFKMREDVTDDVEYIGFNVLVD